MPTPVQIDFVSDVSCPWCAIGLASLERALERLGDEVQAEIRFQPFELNPNMPPGGQDVSEHLTQKYGSTPDQQAQIRDRIRARGAELGFSFNPEGRGRVYNTFDAHRLLMWAESEGAPGQQLALKKGLLAAHHGRAESPESHEVLLRLAAEAGLDTGRAQQVLASDEFAAEVRDREQDYQQAGIHAVPAVIVNQRHLISGGQPVEVFERALRQIASGELV